MSVYKTIENGPQVLHDNRVKFPKDTLLHCSVHKHGRRDVRATKSGNFSMPVSSCWPYVDFRRKSCASAAYFSNLARIMNID